MTPLFATHTCHQSYVRAVASLNQYRWGYGVLSLWLLLCALLLGATPHAAYAQDTSPDLPTYETWLREAFAAAQRGDRLGLGQVAPQLIETSTIRDAEGTLIPIDNRWLEEALQEEQPDLPQIAQRLGALIETLSHPNTDVPDNALQRLQEMLNNPPFAQTEEGDETRNNDLLLRFLEWLFRQLDRLFGDAGGPGTQPIDVVGWLLVGVSILILVGAGIYLFINMRRSLTREAHVNISGDDEIMISAAAAFQQASSLAHDGDYRTAMRYLYLSALLWLDERELLRYDRALTNREYLERLRDNPDLRAHLTPIVDTFDRVWYGYDALNADDFASYQQQVEDLRKRF